MGEDAKAGAEVEALEGCHGPTVELKFLEHLPAPALSDFSDMRLKFLRNLDDQTPMLFSDRQ
jgi:hypothetical protein